MTARKSKPKKVVPWWKSLDGADIREAMDEACVDAYDEHEQCMGLTTMAMEELAFPFPAKVMGEPVSVVDAETPEHDPFGLDLIVLHKQKRYAIAAGSVEMPEPLPDGHLFLAAYLHWRALL
ncbi:MAG: hypothetical protein ABL888_06680 [Pirellulaceae bacterium]